MERVMSPEERIKRAEEIYYRRRAQEGIRVSTTSVNVGRRNRVSLGRKMVIQLLVCACIYAFFFLIKDKENYFSKQTIEAISSMLNYDINLGNLYNNCVDYFKKSSLFKLNNNESENENLNGSDSENDGEENNTAGENNTENIDLNSENTSDNEFEENNAGIGGSEVTQEQIDQQSKSQMEIDAEYIKQNYNLIIPVNGYITSGFGDREPTEIISAFHQGVDIGATQGTPICAAMEGTVVAASYAGDYGNHIKIQNGDVLTVYAHCSELDVSVGDYVSQNQTIGKVGATRKSNRTTSAF